MKQAILCTVAALALCLGVSALAAALAGRPAALRVEGAATEAATEETAELGQAPLDAPAEPPPQTQPEQRPDGADGTPDGGEETAGFDRRFHLPVQTEDGLESMSLYRYVLGAVLGEMPAGFETEALKAQAVACRTYALRLYTRRRHTPAAVCTDPGCCMCWTDPEAYAAENGEALLERVAAAVGETDGLVIRYGDELIDATFFSCSGGRTESAADVWGGEVAYLQAVDSPDEQAPYDTDTKTVSAADFVAVLTRENEMTVFSDDGADWLGPVTYTAGGGVETAELGGCIYTGTQLRRLFGLRSTRFELAVNGDAVTFTTHGFGHRVGLSQYGANAMAAQGSSFEEILCRYYTGVTVAPAEE